MSDDLTRQLPDDKQRTQPTLQTILERINAVAEEVYKTNAKLDQVDGRLDKLDAKLDQVDARLDKLDAKLDQVDARLDKLDGKLDRVDGRLDRLDLRIEEVRNELLAANYETQRQISVLNDQFLRNMSIQKFIEQRLDRIESKAS